MKFLIDTNICIYIINRRPPEVILKFRRFDAGEIGVSAITVSELAYGAEKSAHQKENRRRLEAFLMPFEVLPYDDASASAYGSIRTDLEKSDRVIGPLDMLIAAHAVSQERVLVTNNEDEFRRVPGLIVENWAK